MFPYLICFRIPTDPSFGVVKSLHWTLDPTIPRLRYTACAKADHLGGLGLSERAEHAS